MDRHNLSSGVATAAIVGITALVGAGTMPGAPPAGRAQATQPSGNQAGVVPPACAGVTRCHVVATVDVDGDARADQVGWRQLNERQVQIRVHTAAGSTLTATVGVRLWWGGGAWGGATRVDGIPGAELLIGSQQGAHTPMYTMLTYRGGHLAVEKSPSALSALWQVDAAYGDYMGWWRHKLSSGQVAMTQKIAVRVDGTATFKGHNVTYVWTKTHWARSAETATSYPSVRAASVIGGFHVAGLQAFPGLS